MVSGNVVKVVKVVKVVMVVMVNQSTNLPAGRKVTKSPNTYLVYLTK